MTRVLDSPFLDLAWTLMFLWLGSHGRNGWPNDAMFFGAGAYFVFFCLSVVVTWPHRYTVRKELTRR